MRTHLPADTRPPPASSFGRIDIESVTTRLVVFIVAMFVLDRFLFRQGVYYSDELVPRLMPMIGLFQFSAGLAFTKWELWRLVTWPFVHFSPWHLLVNVAALHCFGPVLESHYGSRRFLIFYMLCALGGVVMYVGLLGTNYLMQNRWVPMFGATAPVLGLLVAAIHVAPDAKATIYDLIPVRIRDIALALLGLSLFAVFTWGRASFATRGAQPIMVITIGGAAAHLGGAAVGLALIRSPQWVRIFDWRPFRRPPPF